MRSVVVAEDEELFRRELAAATPWEDFGFVLVGEAADGQEALELIRERKPDLVLADIRMPRVDGLALLARVAEELAEDERPLIVLITGHSEFEYARSALRLGAADYLLKPLDDAELAAVLVRMAEETDRRERGRSRSEEFRAALGLTND